MTPAQTAKLVAVLMAAYPNAKISDEASTVYERMLADLDYATANAAVERLLATSKWIPTVAEIRETALTLGSGETRPGGDAWGDVLAAVGRYGCYRSPAFEDPLVAKCVDALGWREICLSENQVADRARFIQLYDQLAATDRRLQLSEPLPAMRLLREAQAKHRLPERTGPKSIGAALVDLDWPAEWQDGK